MQIATLIGTFVLSPDGERLGYVKAVFPAKGYHALSSLVCVDEEEEEFVLPARAVLAVKDAVIATRARIPSPTGIPSPLGRAAFSETGEFLGTVKDLTLGDAPELVIKNGEREVSVAVERAAMGGTVIVYERARPKRKARPKKPPEQQETGNAARCDLIGRRVKKTVYDAFGLPVALAGERVTPEMLSLARKRNRLLALAVNTLTLTQ